MAYPTVRPVRPAMHLPSSLILVMIVAKVALVSATSMRRWRSLAKAPAPVVAFVSNASVRSLSDMQYGRNLSVVHIGLQTKSSRWTQPWPWPSRSVRRTSSLRASSDMTAKEVQMKEDALKMVNAAIQAVDPNVAVRDRLKIEWDGDQPKLVAKAERNADAHELIYDLSSYDKIRIISFGKASAAMALATAKVLSGSLLSQQATSIPVPKLDGIVIIKDDHATDEEIKILNDKYNIIVRSASHPVPDARSVAGANEALQIASSSDERTLLVACISGGGSALFCSPREGLTLEDLMATNSRLLESGMPIEYMNIIRKRLEKGKGGRLAAAAYPATVLSLVLSDIIGDPLDLIASGPTVPDGSNWDDACRLVEEYGLNAGGNHELPESVLDLLQMGKDGKLEDTPKSSHPAFCAIPTSSDQQTAQGEGTKKLSETILVGNNYAAVMAAADEATKQGYNAVVLGTRVDGEASCVAGSYIAMAEMLSRQRNDIDMKYPIGCLPIALIAGGETIVTLPPKCKGKGGRNQELALSAAMKMHEMGLRDVVLASVGTDGTDGPTDSAGAVVHGGIVNDETIGDAKEALKNHDAYTFFNALKKTKSLVMTGPTGTNVADICVTLVK